MKDKKEDTSGMFLPKNISNVNAAMLSKLVGSSSKGSPHSKLDIGILESISKKARGKSAVSKDIMELFPDVEFCADTVSHSILSPNDMYTRGLRLTLPNIKIGAELKGLIINTIKEQLKHYNFESNQAEIIKKALFIDGSYSEVFIPEASLDEMLATNNTGEITLESYASRYTNMKIASVDKVFKDGKMQLKDIPYLTVENSTSNDTGIKLLAENNMEDLLNITITSDVSVLNDSLLEKYLVNKSLNKVHSLTKEAAGEDTSARKLNIKEIFRDPDKYKTIEEIRVNDFKSSRRDSVGRPLVLHVEHFAIKPIWSGTPDNHIGYFLLLDSKGNPVREDSDINGDDDMPGMTDVTASTVNKLISKAREGLKTMTDNTGGEIPNSEEIYGKILEEVIINRMNKSPFMDIGNFNENQHFTKVMFNRAMQGKHTRVLFLPHSLVAYYAYDFKNNGVGRSKLEKVTILYSMRAIMLFGTLMANINNSIPLTEVTAVIDEKEPDVESAMKMVISHTLKNRQLELPIGMPRTQDMLTWVRHLGLSFNFQHSRLPETKITMADTSRSIKVPEDMITEKLEELIYMQFGLNSDQVKTGMSQANFATTLINQNKLYTNRIMGHQDKTEPMQSRHVATIIRNDAVIRDEITKIISDNQHQVKMVKEKFKLSDKEINEVILDLVIEDITVNLPRPESNEGDNLKDTLAAYTTGVDDFLNTVFDSKVMDKYSVGTEMSDNAEHIKAVIKAMMVKEWAVENNYLKGFNAFTTLDDEDNSGNNYLQQFEIMMGNFSKILVPYLKSITDESKDVDNQISKITTTGEATDEPLVDEPAPDAEPTGDEPSVDDTGNADDVVPAEPTGEDLTKI